GTEGKEALQNFQKKEFPTRKLCKDAEKMESYKNDISNYLLGESRAFSSNVHLCGTTFQKEVWRQLQAVQYGEVVTYSDIANRMNRPGAVRAVANAIGRNPLLFIVPCHRIIRKDGSLSGFRAGTDLKKKLLALES